MRRLLLISALLTLALAPAALANPAPKANASIVGGTTASISDWPSIAFLAAGWDSDQDGQIDQIAGCTGTVVAPRWIVSAAHCAFQPNGDPVDAMVTLTGVANINTAGGQAIAADQLVVDPNWDPQTLAGDALLVHLKAASSRPAMKLAKPAGQYVTKPGVPNAAGWGTIDEKSEIGTDVLQEAYLELQQDSTCAAFAADFDPATQTCAGTYETAGACHGDSGGPLIAWDKATGAPALWGLTSYGPQLDHGMLPCELHAPAVYSWVPGFSAFLGKYLTPPPPPQPRPEPQPRPQPRPPVITPQRDVTAPALTHARITPKRIRVARKGATISRRRGAKLSFDLSESAAVTVTVIKQKGAKRLSPSVPLVAPAGRTKRGFSGRLAGRALKRGRYKLLIEAVDTSGNAATPRTVGFRIVR